MALGSTQPLVKMNTRNIPGGNGSRCVRPTTSPPSCAECHEIWALKPPGTPRATRDLLGDSFTFYLFIFLLVSWDINAEINTDSRNSKIILELT